MLLLNNLVNNQCKVLVLLLSELIGVSDIMRDHHSAHF